MKNNIVLIMLLSQVVLGEGCYSSETRAQRQAVQQPVVRASEQGKREWQAATYRGIIVGQSTRADMLRVFGEPQWSGKPGDQMKNAPKPEIWYEYAEGGEFSGKLTVVTDKHSSVIKWTDLHPQNLTKEEAIKYFGDEYIITKYDFDQCLGNEESAPLYESPDGQIVNIEYRKRGIALSLDFEDKISQIIYVSMPIGATSSRCNK